MPILKNSNRTVLFIHIPKTGGTSIERFFAAKGVSVALWSRDLHGSERQGFPCSPQHFHLSILNALFPDSFSDAKVAVVRHPVTRIVSEYRHRMGIRLRRGRSVVGFEKWIRASFNRAKKDYYFKDNHFRPQVEFIDKETSIFRLEEGLENPIRHIAQALSVSLSDTIEIPVKNSGIEMDVDISPVAATLIEEFYVDDMKEFGYFGFVCEAGSG
jgi:hypothetical protein